MDDPVPSIIATSSWREAYTYLKTDLAKSPSGQKLLTHMVETPSALPTLLNLLVETSLGQQVTPKHSAHLGHVQPSLPPRQAAAVAVLLPSFQSATKARQAYQTMLPAHLTQASDALGRKDEAGFERTCEVLSMLLHGVGQQQQQPVNVPMAQVLAVLTRAVSRTLGRATTCAGLKVLHVLLSTARRALLPWAWPVCDLIEAGLRISHKDWPECLSAALEAAQTACELLGAGVACRLMPALVDVPDAAALPALCAGLNAARKLCPLAVLGAIHSRALGAEPPPLALLAMLAELAPDVAVRRACVAAMTRVALRMPLARDSLASVERRRGGGTVVVLPQQEKPATASKRKKQKRDPPPPQQQQGEDDSPQPPHQFSDKQTAAPSDVITADATRADSDDDIPVIVF